MANSLTYDPIRELPIYQAGFAAGRDVGLRLALDAHTSEHVRQETMAAEQVQRDRGRYVYAEGVLLNVTRVVASRFRQ
jgi:hypothetical protein